MKSREKEQWKPVMKEWKNSRKTTSVNKREIREQLREKERKFNLGKVIKLRTKRKRRKGSKKDVLKLNEDQNE